MKTVKVSCHTVTMEPQTAQWSSEQDAMGQFAWRAAEVRVAASLQPAEQARTLVHELLHACFRFYNLKTEKLTEEDVCTALDGPLTALLTDNPLLTGWLHQAVVHGKPIFEGL